MRLRDLQVSKLTLLGYRDAVTAFCWFCHWHFGHYARDVEELDSMCFEFVESCWEELEARSVPSTTLAGVQHFLQRRRCLPRAWWLLDTWALFDMPARALRIPTPLLFALVGKALSEGLYGQAAALALCFADFLRTGEMLQMQYSHIALFPEGAVVALPLTKMGRRRGAAEIVTVDCPVALRLFMRARGQCHLEEKLVISPDFCSPMVAGIDFGFGAGPRRLATVRFAPWGRDRALPTTWQLGVNHVQGSLDLHLHCPHLLGGGYEFARQRAN